MRRSSPAARAAGTLGALGLGAAAANDLMNCRTGGRRFISVEELSMACPKVSQAHIEQLKAVGALGEMPEESQMTLF